MQSLFLFAMEICEKMVDWQLDKLFGYLLFYMGDSTFGTNVYMQYIDFVKMSGVTFNIQCTGVYQ